MTQTRLEHDLLGEREVPAERYYGIQTLRALENFNMTGIPIAHYPRLVNSLAYIKKAAALANADLGLLELPLAQAIAQTCDLIIGGSYHSEFVVDLIQGGAGTSTNMHANEVIANLALETGRSVYEIVLEKGYLSKAELDEILSPEVMTQPRYRNRPGNVSSLTKED
jgi:aspartate ammonia-lyase